MTENGRHVRLGAGLWERRFEIGSYRAYVIDPDSGAAAVQTVGRWGNEKVQLLVRIAVRAGMIREVETLVAREGDTCCWAPERLDSLGRVFDQSVSPAGRMTRAALRAVADDYFTALHVAGTAAYRRPAMTAAMNRFENGKQTTNVVGGNRIIRWNAATQLDQAMFGKIAVVNRRYPVLDTQNGALLGIVVFEYPGSLRPSEIIAEFFKMRDAKIDEIRAVMVKAPSTGWP